MNSSVKGKTFLNSNYEVSFFQNNKRVGFDKICAVFEIGSLWYESIFNSSFPVLSTLINNEVFQSVSVITWCVSCCIQFFCALKRFKEDKDCSSQSVLFVALKSIKTILLGVCFFVLNSFFPYFLMASLLISLVWCAYVAHNTRSHPNPDTSISKDLEPPHSIQNKRPCVRGFGILFAVFSLVIATFDSLCAFSLFAMCACAAASLVLNGFTCASNTMHLLKKFPMYSSKHLIIGTEPTQKPGKTPTQKKNDTPFILQ